MKKSFKKATAIMLTIITCTAKSDLQQKAKMLLLLFIATFIFSSCSRNTSSSFGCGAFPYKKTTMLEKVDKKEIKSALNFKKCPQL